MDDRLIESGLVIDNAVRNDQRRQLEHELATTFIAQQRERVPAERTRLWGECLRLVDEIERLNDDQRTPETSAT